MSSSFKIYTCGNGVNAYEDIDWRNKFEIMLRRSTDKELSFAHPPKFYSYLDQTATYIGGNKCSDWELNNIQNSDIVVIYTDSVKERELSIVNLAFNIGYIAALNRNGKTIEVISFGETIVNGSWFSTVTHVGNCMEDAVDYLTNVILL